MIGWGGRSSVHTTIQALQKMVACVEAMGQALELLAKVDEKLTTRIIDGIFAAYDHLDDLSGTLECLIDDELVRSYWSGILHLVFFHPTPYASQCSYA